jgi:hypothetical protein
MSACDSATPQQFWLADTKERMKIEQDRQIVA